MILEDLVVKLLLWFPSKDSQVPPCGGIQATTDREKLL